MKRNEKTFKAGLLLLLCGGLYAFQLYTSEPVDLTLEEALAKKMVSCKIASTGAYSGESVSLTITNLSASNLNISIPNGTVFKPAEEGDQDLIIASDKVLAINGKATSTSILDGFCMEASDHSPQADNGMKLSKTSNANLQALTQFLNKKGYDENTIQQAVWVVSDGQSISYVDNEDVKAKELRTFLSTLTKQPDPWYETEQKIAVTEERVIESKPVSVNGKIQFVSDGKIKIHEVVKNAYGKVMDTSEELEFPKQGKWNYQFTLTVEGWEKGNYTVFVMNGTKTMEAFPFTI